jgi:predicted AAA+ superfamily ATPase
MNKRHLMRRVRDALADTPVVFVQGPRQCGKTTLARQLQEQGYAAEYVTLDRTATLRAARADPDGFVDSLPERIILDEVQRAPELFVAIKASVDRRRTPGRFLLTGSAQALLLPRVSESLAGRMELLTLWPFSQGEIEGRVDAFVDACFFPDFAPPKVAAESWPALAERIARGGFPEAVARAAGPRRRAWFEAHVTTLMQRDVRDLANITGLLDLPLLLRLAAARTMGLVNFSDLARDASMPQTTLKRYWSLFEVTFLIRPLRAWSANLGTRLVRAPKLVFGDSGLLCHLLGLDAARLRSDDLKTGAVLECFVASELTRQIGWSETQPALSHYRTHTQQEVDFVLEDRRGRLVGIEVKKTASPKAEDFKGLRHLRENAAKRFLRGILLYTGSESVAFGPNLYALPVSALWKMGGMAG